ncbi:hypothetical protein COBT_000703 [Conglomerata obtusa]
MITAKDIMIYYIKQYLFLFLLLFRLLNSFLLRTIFEPDEIWQNLEPIHYLLFNKGEMTWDWMTGIRSFNYVLIYFIPQYTLYVFLEDSYYKYCHLGYKFMNGFIAALCDYYTIKLYELYHSKTNNIIFITFFSHALWLYSPRSHINSFEMFLAVLIYYLFKKRNFQKKRNVKNNYFVLSVVLMTYISYIRPTVIFLHGHIFLKKLLNVTREFLSIIITFLILFAIDSLIYKDVVLPPFNFYMINVHYKVSTLFSTQPFYTYIIFVTILTGFLLPAAIYNFYLEYKKNLHLKSYDSHQETSIRSVYHLYKEILIMLATYLIFYSTQGHKEMRFILAVVPFINILGAKLVNNKLKLIIFLQFLIGIYIGYTHQRYDEVITYLRNQSMHTSVNVFFFVCPYSMPAYSYLCKDNVNIKYLSQNPDIYSKCQPKLYNRFGNNILKYEYDAFMINGHKNYDFDAHNYVIIYDWIYEKFRNKFNSFTIVKKCKYADFVFEKEKGKIIYILEKLA